MDLPDNTLKTEFLNMKKKEKNKKVTIKKTTLLQNLDRILTNYHLPKEERTLQIKKIVEQFTNRTFLKYDLDGKAFLILCKDERKIKHLRRYENAPFPLLSSLEDFSCYVGQWNEELLQYGIKTREKNDDKKNPPSPLDIGIKIHLAYYKTLNSKGNNYLRKQYRNLEILRETSQIIKYWKLSWKLMSSSLSFRIASLNSWNSLWYKTYKYKELQNIFGTLQKILSLKEQRTLIYNVWIESPRDKWRQLGVPKKAWRLYLHMLNMFLIYIYEPTLPCSEYEGFIFNRGTKSWWMNFLWSDLIKKYNFIVEVDLSSAFPNAHRRVLSQILKSDGLIPPNYINLILTHLQSPLHESSHFPTFETYVENLYNKNWRTSERSLHMGLGISPTLFVILLDRVLKESKISNTYLKYKWYADDGSFYFNLRGLFNLIKSRGKSLIWVIKELTLGRNLILSLLNEIPLFQSSGIKLCPKKSGIIRFFWIWLRSYKCLGLKLYTNQTYLEQLNSIFWNKEIPLELMGYTRGRGANPSKKKLGTKGSRKKLNFLSSRNSSKLNLTSLLSNYKKYFGLIIAELYSSSKSAPRPYRTPNFPLTLLGKLMKRLKYKSNKNLGIKLNIYNAGSKLNEILLKINNSDPLESEWKKLYPNLERELNFKWKSIGIDLESKMIENPFNIKEEKEILLNYFKKYNELKIEEEELLKLREEYSKQPKP